VQATWVPLAAHIEACNLRTMSVMSRCRVLGAVCAVLVAHVAGAQAHHAAHHDGHAADAPGMMMHGLYGNYSMSQRHAAGVHS